MKSAYLSNLALKSLNRFGDIFIPKNGEFPSFSEYGGLEHIDKMVAYAPQDDIKSLNLLLTILAFMPTFVLKWIVNKTTTAYKSNGPLAPLFRQLYYALRGLIYGCYYSERPGSNYKGKDPVEIINFSINRVID